MYRNIGIVLTSMVFLHSCEKKQVPPVPSTEVPKQQASGTLPESPAETSSVPAKATDLPASKPTVAAASKRPVNAAMNLKIEQMMAAPDWETTRIDAYRAWGEIAPADAIAHAQAHNPGASTACVGAVLDGWSKVRPDEAVSWLQAQKPNAERAVWMNGMIQSFPDEKLENLGQVVNQAADTPGGMNAITAYTDRLILLDPARAFNWVEESFADPGQMAKVSENTMKSWVIRDSENASMWLSEAPQDAPWRDAAIAGLVRASVYFDPTLASQWAGTIANPDLKEELSEFLKTVDAQ